jgi:hypothetical protein|tara:strand:+ start:252 stop:476 length:225 start_codon:yes stop_codon:yes gene_type:complete
MFICIATKPLNDRTDGFRFNLLGLKGLTRKRQKVRRWGLAKGKSMQAVHLGKRSIYLEKSANKASTRRVRHFAG